MKRYDEYKATEIPWLDTIPSHWVEKRAKYLFNKENRQPLEEDEVITCFRDGVVTLRRNRRTTGFTESLKEIGYQGIKKGDLVIHQMDAFAGATGVSDSDGKGTPVYSVCTPKDDSILTKYYAKVIRLMGLNGFIQSLYRGIRERSSDFRFETFVRQLLPIPSLAEQEKIVKFLESKTLCIDAYVAERERELCLLNELKESEIANVITRGINPDVKMKDSGIPWIGMIPEHWEVRRLSQVAYEHFISNKNIHHQNLLSLSYGRIIRKDINTTEGLLPASFDTYQVVERGNIVLRLTDLQNDQKSLRVGLVREEGIVTSAYVCLGISNNSIAPEYLYNTLHSYDIKKLFYSMGGGLRQNLNWQGLKKIDIPLPPPEEQKAIVSYIEDKCNKINSLITELEGEIEYLKEYKQKLIADCVTGQIDVQSEI